MKKLRAIVPGFLLAVLASVPARPADGVPASAILSRAKQTRARIEILFRHRNEPPPPLAPNQNPFRTSSDVVPSAVPSSPSVSEPPAAPTSDDVLLKRAVATLKIGGTVVIGDQIHVTINQETYREGSIITARILGMPVYLRVRRITPNSVTFALNDSELIQPF